MTIPEIYDRFLQCSQVCTDSRKIVNDSMFFALKGANFNGNEHALAALEGGCTFAIVDEEINGTDERVIRVDNVLRIMQDLANHHRNKVDPIVLGITGSNGKTTTKELISSVLQTQFKIHATKGNFNNHIGVPLTLLAMPNDTEIAVIEMGANHVGEIKDLSAICDPVLGVITNIGKAHLEGFGSIEGVIKGKGELYDHIRAKEGEVLVSGDNELLMGMSKDIKRMTYGIHGDPEVKGTLLNEAPFLEVGWSTSIASSQFKTNLSGIHNLENTLCAVCVGVKLGVDAKNIDKAISEYVPSDNRSQWIQTKTNKILLDAYNANPSSMELAIANFSKLDPQDQLLILGDMNELGEVSSAEHRSIVDLVANSGSAAIFVGPEFGKLDNVQFPRYSNTDELISAIKEIRISGKQILIKGSRGIALEKVVEFL